MSIKYSAILLLVILLFGCHKDNAGLNASSLYGTWDYQVSILDTLQNGQWASTVVGVDENFAYNFGAVVEFRKPDTVFFTSYAGSRTWCNYAVSGQSLILIGSAVRDTMQIKTLDSKQLVIGWEHPTTQYWAQFIKE